MFTKQKNINLTKTCCTCNHKKIGIGLEESFIWTYIDKQLMLLLISKTDIIVYKTAFINNKL